MERVQLSEATAEQIRRFARSFLGLEVSTKDGKDRLIGRLAEVGYTLDFIQVLEEQPAPTGGPDRGGMPFNTRESDKKIDGKPIREIRITIHQQDKPGGDEPVPVSVNGRLMWIPRGTPSWVPEPYVEALNNAEEAVYPEYDPDRDGGLGGLRDDERRMVKSYPFSFS